LPDAFTPNGDGRNDIFRVITDNPNIQVVNLEVFNRWGQRVFTSNLNNEGWDGIFKGAAAEGGTYFWYLRYRVRGNLEQTYTRQGDLVLIR
jgi:gliding motility-associated-like protein